jgi:hypothetical protein
VVRLRLTGIWAVLLLAGCSLEKRGSGDELAFVQDSDLTETVLAMDSAAGPDSIFVGDDSAIPDTTIEDTTVEDTLSADADTGSVTDMGTDTGSDIPIVCPPLTDGVAVDLTAVGTIAWGHYGRATASSYDRKVGAEPVSPPTLAGFSFRYSMFEVPFSWSDGTPTTSATSLQTGIYASTDGAVFKLQVTGDGAVRTLRLYIRNYMGSGGTLAASTGASSGMLKLSSPKTTSYACDIVFSTSAKLDVSYTKTSGLAAAVQSMALF